MGKWLERAAALDGSDNSDNSDNSSPIGTIVTNGTLTASITDGLGVLAEAPAPRVRCHEAWPQVTADAQRLASEGWAGTALSLGWSELDLFGAATDPEGEDGLAVKLNGRRVVALCRSFATVADPRGGRTFLYRGGTDNAQLLWALGRGQ